MSKVYSDQYLGDTADYFKRSFISGFKESVLLIKPVHLIHGTNNYKRNVKTFEKNLTRYFEKSCKGGIITYSLSNKKKAEGFHGLIPCNTDSVEKINDFKHIFIDPAVGLSGFKSKAPKTWGRQGNESKIFYYSFNSIKNFLTEQPQLVETLTVYQYVRSTNDFKGGIKAFKAQLGECSTIFKYMTFIKLNDHVFITLSKKPVSNSALDEQIEMNRTKPRIYSYEFNDGRWSKFVSLKIKLKAA